MNEMSAFQYLDKEEDEILNAMKAILHLNSNIKKMPFLKAQKIFQKIIRMQFFTPFYVLYKNGSKCFVASTNSIQVRCTRHNIM